MDEYDDTQTTSYTYAGYGSNPQTIPGAYIQFASTKVPPAYDGKSSWFKYEEDISDWCDVTELEGPKRGPAMRNRLIDDALPFRVLLDKDELKNANDVEPNLGVNYLLKFLRPHFVKGGQSVFLWRFFQLFKSSRGQQDLQKWLTRMTVMQKRLTDSWMDLQQDVDVLDPGWRAAYLQEFAVLLNAVQQNNALLAIANQQLEQEPDRDDPALIADSLRRYNEAQKNLHRRNFPIGDNLYALLIVVLSELNENQRERFTTTMSMRNIDITHYNFLNVRSYFIELFCHAKTSLDNPNFRPSGGGRSFCILEEGWFENEEGYWVEDDDTQECGFLSTFEDVFWTCDDMTYAWTAHRFKGRKVRRGQPRGKGKGRGKGGRHFFYGKGGKGKGKGKSKGKSKGKGYTAQDNQDNWADFSKGKGKGKKGKKGKDQQDAPQGDGKGHPNGKGKGYSHAVHDQDQWNDEWTWWSGDWWSSDEWSSDAWYGADWWNQSSSWDSTSWQDGQSGASTTQPAGNSNQLAITNGTKPDVFYADYYQVEQQGTAYAYATYDDSLDAFVPLEYTFIGKHNLRPGHEPIKVSENPTYVISDLGCTRAMGSRVAIEAFASVAHHYGMT